MHNYFYLSQSYLGNIYVMHIHLLGRHDVNLFHPQAFVSNKVFQVCPYFFFWAVSRRYGSCYFDFTRLFIPFRVVYTLRQVVFGLPANFFLSTGLLKKIWVLSLSEFQVVLLVVSSRFWTHETWLVYNRFQTHSMQTILV